MPTKPLSAWLVSVALLGACRREPTAAPEPAASEAPASEAPASDPGPEPAAAEAAPGAPSHVVYELEGNRLKLPDIVRFAGTLDGPGRGSEVALEHIRGYLAAKDYVTLMRIEAHVSGPDAQALSERRALSVARWLVKKGIDCKRLLPVGFGDTKPIADGSTPEGRQQNTRIEAHNAELRGRAIGGMPVDGGGTLAGDPCR